MNVYSIKDLKAAYFMQPFVSRNKGEAVRSFSSAVNDAGNSNNLMAKYPADYALFELGTFDEETGAIIPFPSLNLLGTGSDYINQQ
jgi:hypothetical protein